MAVGIITRLELRTYAAPNHALWSVFKAYSPGDGDRVMAAFTAVQKAMDADDRMGLIMVATVQSLTVILLYRGDAPDDQVFSPFDDIAEAATLVPPDTRTEASVSRLLAMPGPFRCVVKQLAAGWAGD